MLRARMNFVISFSGLTLLFVVVTVSCGEAVVQDYSDALTKSILFFEGQRSGKIPSDQRLTWRKDSALTDGKDIGMDLVGGYYDAGDNVKFNFPMAFSTTLLAWSVIEFRKSLGSDLPHALNAIRWATDYFLKATDVPGTVVAQVGDPFGDHNCWERPEDMDTPRTTYVVNTTNAGSEVAAEIAAALAASSMVFKSVDRSYSSLLRRRAIQVFEFADKYQGSYDASVGAGACPFYCDISGYMDDLIWGAAWLYRVTKSRTYLDYVNANINLVQNSYEFGWDSKHAGINVLLSKLVMETPNSNPYVPYSNNFVCSLLPESPKKSVTFSAGGLMYKPGGSNLQHATALSFLVVVYARYLGHFKIHQVSCEGFTVSRSRLVQLAKSQVDYILGNNPMGMSYMVGYGTKFPQRIHHRGSSLPSTTNYPNRIKCKEGTPYFESNDPNPNLFIGAIVGGPANDDRFADDRVDAARSEPTTYINAPFVGLLAYFKGLSRALARHHVH